MGLFLFLHESFLEIVLGVLQNLLGLRQLGGLAAQLGLLLDQLRRHLLEHHLHLGHLLRHGFQGVGLVRQVLVGHLDVVQHALVVVVSHEHSVLLPGGHQVLSQPLNFAGVLLQLGALGHLLVDLGLVLDVFGPVSVVQSGEGLLQVDAGRGDGGDDGGLGPAAQGVLQ